MKKELKNYLDNVILEEYKDTKDESHDKNHILNVLRNSKRIITKFDLSQKEKDIIETSIYFHDLGNIYERKNHHIISSEMVLNNKEIKSFFNENEIKIISNCCLNHRSSNKNKFNLNLLEKIVNDSDSTDGIAFYRLIERVILYNKKNHVNSKDLSNKAFIDISTNYRENDGKRLELILNETKLEFERDIYYRKIIINNDSLLKNEICSITKKILNK